MSTITEDDDIPGSQPTPEQLKKFRDDLAREWEARGLIRDTGERRNGEIVWVKIKDLPKVLQ